MRAVLFAVLGFWMLPAIALSQTSEDEAGKVSNEQPGRPLQMPPASSEVKEALDDFARFERRNAWERALKALYTIPEDQVGRFVDGEDGFIVPVARKRRLLLTALPPEGRAAYRLFYDAEAKKLLEEAEGASELKTLERLYSAYFLTSVGDDATDRLGDLYFELGRFDRAADCWLTVLRDYPDSDLPMASVAVKAALALSRSGRRSELDEVRREVAGRYANDEVTLGGKTARAPEILRELVGDDGPEQDSGEPGAGTGEGPLDLARISESVWQVRFGDSVTAGMTPEEQVQWESNPLSVAAPAVAVRGTRLFANYLGHDFAVDLETGKMLWRSGAFHQVDLQAKQDQAKMVDPARFSLAASEALVWSIGRDLKSPNVMAPFELTCRRADVGDVVWKSSDLPDYAGLDLLGPPLLADGKLFVVGKPPANNRQDIPKQTVLAVRPEDGKVLWKAELGTLRQTQQYYYYGMLDREDLPRLVHRAGAIYVDTHLGVLARLDAASGDVDWGYGYATDPVQPDRMMFIMSRYSQMDSKKTASSKPLMVGDAMLVKGAKSDRLGAIDPDRMTLLWDRPVGKASRLLGSRGDTVFLGGPEIDALGLPSKRLLWSTRVPDGSAQGRLLVRSDGIWQLTPRGIFEIDPESGQVRQIFRGDDMGSVGGDLFLTDRLLVSVSNRSISAYERAAPRSSDAEAGTKGERDEDE